MLCFKVFYLYNRKKDSFTPYIAKVLRIDNDSLEFFKIVDLESGDHCKIGLLIYADGDSIDGMAAFQTNWILGRD